MLKNCIKKVGKQLNAVERDELEGAFDGFVKQGMSEYDASASALGAYHRSIFDAVTRLRSQVGLKPGEYKAFDASIINAKYAAPTTPDESADAPAEKVAARDYDAEAVEFETRINELNSQYRPLDIERNEYRRKANKVAKQTEREKWLDKADEVDAKLQPIIDQISELRKKGKNLEFEKDRDTSPNALSVLSSRFALGEIDQKEFNRQSDKILSDAVKTLNLPDDLVPKVIDHLKFTSMDFGKTVEDNLLPSTYQVVREIIRARIDNHETQQQAYQDLSKHYETGAFPANAESG